MVEQLKRYWIALLVIVLVGLHGAILAMIRMEASQAKINASCEVDLGDFYLASSDSIGPIRLRLHSLSPLNHRMQSRQLIELNKYQIRQAIEEHLRQVPVDLLSDPLLVDLKQQLLDIMIQTVGGATVDEVLITDMRPVDERLQWTFGSPSQENRPKIVMTRRAEHEVLAAEVEEKIAAAKAAEAHGGGHGGGHGDDHGGGHGDDHGGGHGEADAHGGGHGDAHDAHAGDAHGSDGHSDSGHGDSGHGGH